MYLKKGIFFLLIPFFFLPFYSVADNNIRTTYVIDSALDEYGSIIEHIEIFLDKETNKSIDEIMGKKWIVFEDMNENMILDKKHA